MVMKTQYLMITIDRGSVAVRRITTEEIKMSMFQDY
jgi:hypothetical protein